MLKFCHWLSRNIHIIYEWLPHIINMCSLVISYISVYCLTTYMVQHCCFRSWLVAQFANIRSLFVALFWTQCCSISHLNVKTSIFANYVCYVYFYWNPHSNKNFLLNMFYMLHRSSIKHLAILVKTIFLQTLPCF